MKALNLVVALISGGLIISQPSAADTMADHQPLEKNLAGITTFKMRGDSAVKFEQNGDTTTLTLGDEVIASIEAPQFVRKVIKSPNKEYLLVMIHAGSAMNGGGFGSNYHSMLRMQFTKEGKLKESKRLLEKTSDFMKQLNRWVVKIDSVLNDGRTVRMNFGEQKSADDPSMQMIYSWQIRDIVTGKLYRTEGKDEKE